MVVVAQLVEPRIVIPVVAGSSPVDHPTFFFGFGKVSVFEERGEQLLIPNATAGKPDSI